MTRDRLFLVGGAAILGVLIVIGWLTRDRFQPLDAGATAPAFTARNLEGDPVSLADLEGQVVLLNVWATWCEPCRAEMQSLQRLHEILGDDGLRVVAVSVDRPLGSFDAGGNPGGDVEAYVQAENLDFTVWHDPTGEVERTYRVPGIPATFLIDRSGVIVERVVGAAEWDAPEVVERVRRLLEE